MYYGKIIENDTVNCIDGITVSLFMSGCPHHCKGCFNEETWNPTFGTEIKVDDLISLLKDKINAYDIKRHFSILGGEPLAPYNIENTLTIVSTIRKEFNDIKIYLWSGYTIEEINKMNNSKEILNNINYLIEGRFVESKKDLKLKLRGSSNQRIFKNVNNHMIEVNM